MIAPLPEAVTEGSATESALTKVARFSRRWWWVMVLIVALTVLAVYSASRQDDTDMLGLGNSEPAGGMALGRILEAQGVRIVEASSLVELENLADGATTIFLVNWRTLDREARETVAQLDADVVISGSAFDDLDGLTTAIASSGLGSPNTVTAQCSDPDAVAASRVSGFRGAVEAQWSDVEICFPSEDGAGLYASWRQAGHTWRYIADTQLGSNGSLASDGNAALMLRSLGGNERLVWFRHVPASPSIMGGASSLPAWGEPALAIAAFTVFAAALWRGRRMGRVVIEPLPVVVLPGEAVRGRARLYRSAKALDHAAASLRAGTITRLMTRLGLGAHTTPDTVEAAVASASSRTHDQVGPLLYGRPPATESGLVTLATELATLEREVHQ